MPGLRIARGSIGAVVLAGCLLVTACAASPPLADAPAQNTIWQADETSQDDAPEDLGLRTDDRAQSGADDNHIVIVDRAGPWKLTIEHELTAGSVELDLVAPARSADVQIATEPTYAATGWHPIADLSVRTPSTGTQELFVRYRDSYGELVGDQVVAAFTLLGPLIPMTGESVDPDLVRISRVAPDVLQVDMIIGDVVYGETGAAFVSGPDIDVDRLTDLVAIELRVDGSPVEILEVSRQSFPTDNVGRTAFGMHHRLHLRLGDPLPNGSASLTIDALGDTPVDTPIDDRQFSPAIRTNQLGWASDDTVKTFYVSTWSQLSAAIDPRELTGEVIDEAGATILSVPGVPFTMTESTELWRGDLSGAPTTSFDISGLRTPGEYRLCVRMIGCSNTITISESGPWQSSAATVARALFHQRSGIALEAPYTAIARPRPYHPDDGMVIEASDQSLFADSNGRGTGPQFLELVAQRNGTPVPEAWGGHFDAGDWDRRIQHLWMARRLIDLVDEFPDVAGAMELNIPESGDPIPDLVDEALWSIDLFRRLQLSDGAIRGGIEAAEHPNPGSTSWTEELEVFVYAPDAWSSAIYAGVAADAAHVIERYDPAKATVYLDSAVAAMEWAEAELAIRPLDDPDVRIQRAIAAISLYRATGEPRWHELFVNLSPLDQRAGIEPCILATSCESAWRYSRLPAGMGESDIRDNAVESIVSVAGQLLRAADTTAFGWVPEGPNVQLVWGLGPSTPHSVGLMRAYLLTGDTRYRDQAVRNASFSLGGNPAGLSYFTGIGVENPRNPLMVDQLNSGLAVWPGTPVYGSFTTWKTPGWYFSEFLRRSAMQPDPAEWPTLQSFVDIGVFAGQSEFTVQQSHGESIWTFAALAAT